jgi:Na+-transporting methylmalonyl-CoA/oxaloacetate decarboxylase gamma subunit
MIDWNLVVRITGGGFGVTILVLIILAAITWVVGLVIQGIQPKDEETPAEETSAKKA